jgi:hypothetical protein
MMITPECTFLEKRGEFTNMTGFQKRSSARITNTGSVSSSITPMQ